MTYQIKFEKLPSYLYASVTGTNSKQTVIDYWTEIRSECERHNCFRVLAEENLDGPRLDAMDVFTLISEGSMGSLGHYEAIAYVDKSMVDLADFAETVAINRGVPVRVFSDVKDADRWLCDKVSGSV